MTRNELRIRLLRWVKVGVLLAVAGGLSMVGAMEYTARPKFCSTCHIMKPYYSSWKNGSHKQVPCVDCHYEPGLQETFEGKFKALSQVAKYFTGTEGTKPWAEVSDWSCMRPGCHTKRLLSGPIRFGRVRFDHRHHLAELRRGKKLRCTTCHSQIMVGQHMRVAENVCFQCHFHPSGRTEAMNDCRTCHGPPKEVLQVAGRPFRHADYTGRGVRCQNCHAGITSGQGQVTKDRCRTCHNEPSHLRRITDQDFLHTFHVTKHKVECFSCHAEITHRLRKRTPRKASECAPCHGASHGVQSTVYAGGGAQGLKAQPSRMYRTRVDCDSCHVCLPGEDPGTSGPCTATEASCIHCHGKGYRGIKGRIQASIGTDLNRLVKSAGRLSGMLKAPAEDATPKVSPTVAQALQTSYKRIRHNLAVLEKDGSRGMHNPGYARAILDDAESWLAKAYTKLGKAAPKGPPRVTSQYSCTKSCHMGIERQRIGYRDTRFDHQHHLATGALDCNACHSVRTHGVTRIADLGCGSCHHRAKKPARTCATCHPAQQQLRTGKLSIPGTYKADPMAEGVECSGCHAKLKEGHRVADIQAACVSCHEKSYKDILASWRTDGRELVSGFRIQVAQAGALAAVCAVPGLRSAVVDAHKVLKLLDTAGTVHNPDLATTLVEAARKRLAAAAETAQCPAISEPGAAGVPAGRSSARRPVTPAPTPKPKKGG